MTDFDEFEEKGQPENREPQRNEWELEAAGRKTDFGEEFGAETAAPAPLAFNDAPERHEAANQTNAGEADDDRSRTGGRTWGWIGLVVAIASLFIYPVALGLTGIALGIIAFVQGSRTLGVWSACIGAVALLAYYVLVPYYT